MAGLIICGVDDSESAKGAARVARGLSSKLGLGLVFLRVVESGASEEGGQRHHRTARACLRCRERSGQRRPLACRRGPSSRAARRCGRGGGGVDDRRRLDRASLVLARQHLGGGLEARAVPGCRCAAGRRCCAATGQDETPRLTRRSRAASFASVPAPRRRLPTRISRAASSASASGRTVQTKIERSRPTRSCAGKTKAARFCCDGRARALLLARRRRGDRKESANQQPRPTSSR